MTSMLLLTVLEVSGPFADKHDPNLSPQTVEKLYQGSGSYLEKAFGAANFRAGPGLKLLNFFAPMAHQDISRRTELVFPPDVAAEPGATAANDLTLFFKPRARNRLHVIKIFRQPRLAPGPGSMFFRFCVRPYEKLETAPKNF